MIKYGGSCWAIKKLTLKVYICGFKTQYFVKFNTLFESLFEKIKKKNQ